MFGLSWKHWLAILVGGVAVGLVLSAILPHGPGLVMRSAPGLPPIYRPTRAPITIYLPWVLVLGGFVFGVLFRKNAAFLTFAGSAITAGVTLLAKTS
jgi:hypothetical protein